MTTGRTSTFETQPPGGEGMPRIFSETIAQRREAESLLGALERAKAASEANLAGLRQPDRLKQVTGRSAMENAIASTRRLIESYDRVLGDLKRSLSPEDLRLLEDLER